MQSKQNSFSLYPSSWLDVPLSMIRKICVNSYPAYA